MPGSGNFALWKISEKPSKHNLLDGIDLGISGLGAEEPSADPSRSSLGQNAGDGAQPSAADAR